MKKTLFIFVFLFFLLNIKSVLACDPLGCLFGGYKQDILILGEVESKERENYIVRIDHIFSQSKNNFIDEVGEKINIREEKDGEHISVRNNKIKVGGKYLFSLIEKDDLYICKWGCFEIDSTNYLEAKLIKNNSLDDEALQIFINSGGKEVDFSFDYSDYNKEVLTVNGSKSDERKIIRYSFYEDGKNIVNDNLFFVLLFFSVLILSFCVFKIKKSKK